MNQKTTIAITIVSFIAILFWLEFTIGLYQIYLTLTTVNLVWLLPTFALLGLSYLLRTLRWNIILNTYKDKTEGLRLAPILCGGTWMNLIIPFKIAELVRPLWLRNQKSYSLTEGIGSILIERFYDFGVLLLIPVAMSIFLLGGSLEQIIQQITSTMVIFVALAIFFVAIRSDRFIQFSTRIIGKTFSPSKRLRENVPQFTEKLAYDVQKLIKDRKNAPLAFLISLPIWILEATKLVFIGLSLGSLITLDIALFAGSLSYVAGHALIIPSGIGIFFSQALFLALQINPAIATTTALLDVIIYVIWLTVTGAPSIIYLGAGSISLNTENNSAKTTPDMS